MSRVEGYSLTRKISRDGDPFDIVIVVGGSRLSVEELDETLVDLRREPANWPDRVYRRELDVEGPDQLAGVPWARLKPGIALGDWRDLVGKRLGLQLRISTLGRELGRRVDNPR